MADLNAHQDGQCTGSSRPGRSTSPALAVPRPASVSFRGSSVEQLLAAHRAARIRLPDNASSAADLTPACKHAAVRLER